MSRGAGGGGILLKKHLTLSIKGYILRRGYNREVQPIWDFSDKYRSSDWVFLHFMK